MVEELSKSKVDQLGERLKKGPITEADLILLDQYRQSFAEAYQNVLTIIESALREHKIGTAPTGRAAKSTSSIIAKLQRESIRLSQMQDIAGCRIVVPDILKQDELIEFLTHSVFPSLTKIDRRIKASHGYRAVHIIAQSAAKSVEIQIRSRMQHEWAELSEKLSDWDPGIKYGNGNEIIQGLLLEISALNADTEAFEQRILRMPEDLQDEMVHKIEKLKKSNSEIIENILEAISRVDRREN